MPILSKLENLDNRNKRFWFFFLVTCFTITAVFGTDMYVPALPHITQYFAVKDSLVKLTISMYLLSYAISQLIYGPISDAIGRRPTLLIGFSIAIVGSVLCLLAHTIEILIFGRLIQGLGIGATVCLSRSIVKDVASGKELAKASSNITLAIGLAPIFAPLLGGYIQHYLNWRYIFIFYLFYILIITAAVIIIFPESNKHIDPHAIHLRKMLKNYFTLTTNRSYLGHTLCAGSCMAGIIGFYTLSPFILQSKLHLSVIAYSWITMLIAASTLLGKFFNILLLRIAETSTVIIMGNICILLATAAMVAIALLLGLSVYGIVLPFAGFTFGVGMLASNAMSNALSSAHQHGGTASSLYSFLQVTMSFIAGTIASHLSNNTALPLAILLLCLALISNLGYYILVVD